MAKVITVPRLGLTMETATVTTWMKQEGDIVNKGEVICIIETDKASFDVEAPQSGVLVKVMAEEGSVLPVGEVLAVIAQTGESFDLEKLIQQAKADMETPAAVKPAEARAVVRGPILPKEKRELKVSPLARRIAEEKGIMLEDIIGTGPGGSITKEDVLRVWEQKGSIPTQPLIVSKKIPLKGIRKLIADRMSLSWHTAPRVTQVMEVDMSEAIRFREECWSDWEAKGVRVSINDILIKAVSLALMENLEMNSSLKENEIEVYGNVNMGIAVSAERGLIVPVLRNAHQKTLLEIARESAILVQKVREGKIGPDELSFGTFTITNIGTFGIDLFTPIINPPESAILGVGKLEKKVKVVDDDKIAIRSVMNLCLVFDHRVVDGAPAARFLGRVKEILERPVQLKELN
ncbi:MAG: dihydrolipoamide acetyltransferase family protein [Thermodesulfobacteriota bacterium]|jgi:pyruvate dehydrogenase E2 component (dihydrolipoamide acetyltransferase)